MSCSRLRVSSKSLAVKNIKKIWRKKMSKISIYLGVFFLASGVEELDFIDTTAYMVHAT